LLYLLIRITQEDLALSASGHTVQDHHTVPLPLLQCRKRRLLLLCERVGSGLRDPFDKRRLLLPSFDADTALFDQRAGDALVLTAILYGRHRSTLFHLREHLTLSRGKTIDDMIEVRHFFH